MEDECEVVYVAGLGKMIGRTEASIREGIRRGVDWLPKGFKMGARHCWLKDDVREFLRACRDGENKALKVGRKRHAPPTLIKSQVACSSRSANHFTTHRNQGAMYDRIPHP